MWVCLARADELFSACHGWNSTEQMGADCKLCSTFSYPLPLYLPCQISRLCHLETSLGLVSFFSGVVGVKQSGTLPALKPCFFLRV